MKDYIKHKRETLGLSIRAFSRLVGFSFQTVSDWEKGRHLPPVSSVKKIISRLKLDEEEEARLWKSRTVAKKRRDEEKRAEKLVEELVEEQQIDFKKAVTLINSLGDNLSLVHPNHPKLQEARRWMGEEPFIKESDTMMKAYKRHLERAGIHETPTFLPLYRSKQTQGV